MLNAADTDNTSRGEEGLPDVCEWSSSWRKDSQWNRPRWESLQSYIKIHSIVIRVGRLFIQILEQCVWPHTLGGATEYLWNSCSLYPRSQTSERWGSTILPSMQLFMHQDFTINIYVTRSCDLMWRIYGGTGDSSVPVDVDGGATLLLDLPIVLCSRADANSSRYFNGASPWYQGWPKVVQTERLLRLPSSDSSASFCVHHLTSSSLGVKCSEPSTKHWFGMDLVFCSHTSDDRYRFTEQEWGFSIRFLIHSCLTPLRALCMIISRFI